MKQVKVSLPEKVFEKTRREAECLSLTISQYIRMRVSELFRDLTSFGAEKSFVITLENWKEIETYVAAKGQSVQSFLRNAANSEMKKHPLRTQQKTEANRILGS